VSENGWDSVPPFHIVVDADAEPPCVMVTGEIDLATCAAFRDALAEAIEVARRGIVVDARGVTFMGSVGIRELVRALQAVERIEVRAPQPIVRRALETASVGNGLVVVD